MHFGSCATSVYAGNVGNDLAESGFDSYIQRAAQQLEEHYEQAVQDLMESWSQRSR